MYLLKLEPSLKNLLCLQDLTRPDRRCQRLTTRRAWMRHLKTLYVAMVSNITLTNPRIWEIPGAQEYHRGIALRHHQYRHWRRRRRRLMSMYHIHSLVLAPYSLTIRRIIKYASLYMALFKYQVQNIFVWLNQYFTGLRRPVSRPMRPRNSSGVVVPLFNIMLPI